MNAPSTQQASQSLDMMVRTLRLPGFATHHEEVAITAERQGWSFGRYLHHLCELELTEREQRRIARFSKRSGLDPDKTLERFDLARVPSKVKRQVPTLCSGRFVEQGENVLAFGLPGRGKTHLLSAIGHELICRGYRVLFIPAYKLVQRLLVAKRELRLEQELKRLDRYPVVIIDDIGYVQQDREEMEVLFTFLGERYERRSVMITSNLVFSQWDKIFKDTLTTVAAIDRVIHHATILELTGTSYREEAAQKKNIKAEKNKPSKNG
ncbi:MAG: IS21-like element helper ATPase IstB [Myxococcota bacterium]|nr:IS21-like element helper ATPase IstB [Myxococcota bacterium]